MFNRQRKIRTQVTGNNFISITLPNIFKRQRFTFIPGDM